MRVRGVGDPPSFYCVFMPLDAAGRAAHEGVLQQTYGRHKLPRALRVAVTDYLVAKGWAVVDVPCDATASKSAAFSRDAPPAKVMALYCHSSAVV